MEIGAVIRKYRKEKELTQEDMARRLGVTASAVNKWENGAAYPDILLLAPIARLLEISLDTLLAYQETLTEQEVRQLIAELNRKLEAETYDSVFSWARSKIETYPNSSMLINSFAAILNAWGLVNNLVISEEQEEYLVSCYEGLLEEKDESVRMTSADALFSWFIRKEEYERAETYLQYFSAQNPEKKRKQAQICSLTGRREEAFRAYEELLFTGCNMLHVIFNSIYTLALEDGDQEKTAFLANKMRQFVQLFDMGSYYEISVDLEQRWKRADEKGRVQIRKALLECVDTLGEYRRSRLFEHMEFKEVSKDFYEQMKQRLSEAMEMKVL